MMLQWMAYAALCAALFAAAAACVERVFASHGRARRGVWLAAIVLSVIVPVASPLIARSISVAAPATLGETSVTTGSPPIAQPPQLDIIALTAWATASLLFATLLLVAHWRTSRVLRACRRGAIANRPAFISQDFGPAVVGVFRHHIVVPEWVLALGENEQQFIVMHELEHARSSDPVLALLGVCAVIVMPWNVALWWQLSRLRLAIEVDCDARVVARKQSNVVAYGQLLLCVRERGHARRHPVLALSHSRSSLAKRLDALLDRRTRQNRGQLVGLATLAICIAATVAFIPAPHVQTVLRELRKPRVESGVTAASVSTPAPDTSLAETLVTAAAPTPLAIRQRAASARTSARSSLRIANLVETAVPPMSVVPSNPLGGIAPATASPIVLSPPRGVVLRGGVLRAEPTMGAGGRVGGGGRGGFSAAGGQAIGGRARAGGGAGSIVTEVAADSARAGVIRATAARAVIVPRPDTTRPPG